MVVRSVLVPTDFSAPASAALNFAVLIGRRLGAALHVLHVIDTSPSARFWSKRVLSPCLPISSSDWWKRRGNGSRYAWMQSILPI